MLGVIECNRFALHDGGDHTIIVGEVEAGARRRPERRCSTIAAATHSWSVSRCAAILTPPRRRGVEILDSPDVDPEVVTRSLADVARANALFGGSQLGARRAQGRSRGPAALAQRCSMSEPDSATSRAAPESCAAEKGIELTTVGLDSALELAPRQQTRRRASRCVATRCILPFADRSIDIVDVLPGAAPLRRRRRG